MKTSKILNQSGFTLIEGMISGVIVLGCLTWALQYAANTQRISSGQGAKMEAQAVLAQILTKIRGQSSSFPMLLNDSGASFAYVGCFSRKGIPTSMSLGASGSVKTVEGFVALLLNTPDQVVTTTGGVNLCTPPAIEVHLIPTGNPNEIRAISILVTTQAEAAKSASKLITNKTFSIVTRFSSAL